MLAIIVFFIAHWYLSLFFQTFFLHRYASHRMFDMSPFMEKVFYCLTFVCQGSSYLSPYAYAIMHRLHHEHADTEEDPHSPEHDGNPFQMMWRTYKIYSGIYTHTIQVEEKYKANLPNWASFDRMACSMWTRMSWVLVYVAFYYFFSPSIWLFLLIPFHVLMGPIHGAIVNWCSHKFGYINFHNKDSSTNLMKLDLIMMGEGLHNNHHQYPSRANFGVKEDELDPTYPFITMLDKLGIIRLKKKEASMKRNLNFKPIES